MKRSTIVSTILLTAANALAKRCPFSFIVGSQFSFFSLSTIFEPLIGVYGGSLGALSLVVYHFFSRANCFVGSACALYPLVYHIPTFCGSLYWALVANNSSRNYLSSVIGRALCIGMLLSAAALFLVHPVGGSAYLYALPWLIPLSALMVPHTLLFVHAFTSTMITHAVGSAFWIWVHPLTPETWVALVPCVLIERLFIAASMCLAITAVELVGRSFVCLYKKISSLSCFQAL